MTECHSALHSLACRNIFQPPLTGRSKPHLWNFFADPPTTAKAMSGVEASPEPPTTLSSEDTPVEMAPPKSDAYTPERILVTGAAGFIASNTVHRIMRLHPEYKIVVLDKFDYCASIKNLRGLMGSPNLEILKGDIQGGG